jgi:hypothetical protein
MGPHTPSLHASPEAQALPHTRQFIASLLRSAQHSGGAAALERSSTAPL